MAKIITLDGIELAQLILMKDRTSGKIVAKATYQVKAGSEVVRTVPDKGLTFASVSPTQLQQAGDHMTAQEQEALSATWAAVEAALQRLELQELRVTSP